MVVSSLLLESFVLMEFPFHTSPQCACGSQSMRGLYMRVSSSAWGSDKHYYFGGRMMCRCLQIILPLTFPRTKPCPIRSRSDMFYCHHTSNALFAFVIGFLPGWSQPHRPDPHFGTPLSPTAASPAALQGSQEVDLSSVFSPRSAVVQVVVGGLFRERGPLELPVSSEDQWELYWLTQPAHKQGHAYWQAGDGEVFLCLYSVPHFSVECALVWTQRVQSSIV